MKKLLSHLLILNILAVLLASCGTSAPSYNYKELARASIRLNPIEEEATIKEA